MKKLIVLMSFLGLSVVAYAGDTTTNRIGLINPALESFGWGPKYWANNQIIDGNAAWLGLTNTFTSSNTFTSTTTFLGPVNAPTITASFFIGDGSGLTNLPHAGGSSLLFASTGPFFYDGSLPPQYPYSIPGGTLTIGKQIKIKFSINGGVGIPEILYPSIGMIYLFVGSNSVPIYSVKTSVPTNTFNQNDWSGEIVLTQTGSHAQSWVLTWFDGTVVLQGLQDSNTSAYAPQNGVLALNESNPIYTAINGNSMGGNPRITMYSVEILK